jgi:multiple sugar transport system ATP-binding protein
MAEVRLSGVVKRFRDGTEAVRNLDLEIADGEFLVLVGPSGCGKSTVLRMIAGLEDVTAGEISIGAQRVNEVSPAKRNIAMVFQNYALYPHMTVAKNLEIGLKLRGVRKEDRKERVNSVAGTLGISELMNRKPATLSGGQRQRVAMGRAMVRDPAVFLMDEPLSNLDAKLRTEVRAEIKVLQAQLKTTTIFVTHDQIEAMTMADRIAIMRNGRLQQVGTPQNVHGLPANLFVAGFIGSPPTNFLGGTLERTDSGELMLRYSNGACWQLPAWAASGTVSSLLGSDVVTGVRPEHLTVMPSGAVPSNAVPSNAVPSGTLPGTVAFVELLGSDTLVHVDIDAPPVLADQVQEALAADDEAADGTTSGIAQGKKARFTVRIPEIATFTPGSKVALAPSGGAIHFFSAASGELAASAYATTKSTNAGIESPAAGS